MRNRHHPHVYPMHGLSDHTKSATCAFVRESFVASAMPPLHLPLPCALTQEHSTVSCCATRVCKPQARPHVLSAPTGRDSERTRARASCVRRDARCDHGLWVFSRDKLGLRLLQYRRPPPPLPCIGPDGAKLIERLPLDGGGWRLPPPAPAPPPVPFPP